MAGAWELRHLLPFSTLVLTLLQPFTAKTSEPPRPPGRPSPCSIAYPSDVQIEWTCHRVKEGETLWRLFGRHWKDGLRFNRIDRRHIHAGSRLKVPRQIEQIADFTPMPARYRPAESEPKLILVDLAEQFLGAYEYGQLVFSAPVTTGSPQSETPTGAFRISAAHAFHESSLYTMEQTGTFYPMHFALKFHVDREGVGYWFHGRDVPGYPDSRGCVGLYDEAMQADYYGRPLDPMLDDAKRLYEWVIGPVPEAGERNKLLTIADGPAVLIIGRTPGTTAPPSEESGVPPRSARPAPSP
jgi:hypothetical protein